MNKIQYFYFFYNIFLLKLLFQINNIRKKQILLQKQIIQKRYDNTNKWIIYNLCYLSFASIVIIYLLNFNNLKLIKNKT